MALAGGVRLDVVSCQLGHASVAITADVYGHPDDRALEQAARRMGGRSRRRDTVKGLLRRLFGPKVAARDLAAMGYSLTREKKVGGDYYVWSRRDDPRGQFPVLIGDITLVMRFVITPEPQKRSIEEEAYRQISEPPNTD
jgi:hypothetical protein